MQVPDIEIGTVLEFTDIESEFYPCPNELVETAETPDNTRLIDRSTTHIELRLDSGV